MPTIDEMLKALVFFVLTVASFHTATAGIYKWVDENGQVHYGERPVGSAAERMQLDVRQPAAATEESSEEKTEQTAPAPAQPAAEEGEWVEAPLSRREKRQRCANARERLQNIESRGRLRVTDANGQVRRLTPKERDARIRQVRKDIRKYCR